MLKKALIPTCFIAFLLFFSCSKPCNCPSDVYNDDVPELQLMKQIVEVNTVNFSTGFETYFLQNGVTDDSIFMAHFCQEVISNVRFFYDDAGYFFIESNNGWMVAHATKPELVGTYRYDIQDINGKYYVRDMVETIKYKGYGFVDYYFEHPDTEVPTQKISFVKAIEAAKFFMGTGFYQYNQYQYYTEDEASMHLVENVTKSMALGLSGGMNAIDDSSKRVDFTRAFIDNIRFFDDHSGYFFVYDFNCVNVAHGTQKDLQGKDLYDYQDSKGDYVIRGLVNVAKNEGSGYYDYYWNNPVNGKEEPKRAYVYKVPGIDYFIGSGVYVNN